jgi:hypothetical protein
MFINSLRYLVQSANDEISHLMLLLSPFENKLRTHKINTSGNNKERNTQRIADMCLDQTSRYMSNDLELSAENKIRYCFTLRVQ